MLKKELLKLEALKGDYSDVLVRSVMLKKQLNLILQHDRTHTTVIKSILSRLDHPNERVYVLALVQGQGIVKEYL